MQVACFECFKPDVSKADQALPQTSLATCTTNFNLAIWSSIVNLLPNTVLEKPYCGLMPSCSNGTNLLASSMRRFKSPGVFQCAAFRRHQTKNELLGLGHITERGKISRPRCIVFKKIAVDVQLVE